MACVFGLVCTLDASEARMFRQAMLWFSFVMAAVVALQNFTAKGKIFWLFEMEGAAGPFPNGNHWAAFVELALPLAVYRLFAGGRSAWLYTVMIATMYASVIAVASRAGGVLCTAAMLIVPLVLKRHRFAAGARAKLLLGVLAVPAIFTWTVGPQAIWARLMEHDQYQLRREFLLSSWHMFRERPWSGYGLGTWATVYPQFAIVDPGTHANSAHNEWAQWAVEGGIPLVAAMLGLAGWVLCKVPSSPWAFGLVLVLLHSWVEYPFQRQALAGWFAAMLGLLAIVSKDHVIATKESAGLRRR
jgi:O-antigen polymerase